MAKGPRAQNKLERWEVAMVKAMIAEGMRDQEILAYFTRPSRTINHGRIKEIRDGTKHRAITAASADQLRDFIAAWPHIDPATGLHYIGDELLLKAREAMLQAVQGFNNPRAYFKSELFIVLAVIAWTYLLHWHFRQKGVDYRYFKDGEPLKTRHGAYKHWELETCLEHADCPVDEPSKANLKFLIGIRHEIEHQMTQRIDHTVSAKLQACCLNFNRTIKELSEPRYALDNELSFALQFSSIEREQRDILLKETNLPAHIIAAQMELEEAIPDEIAKDTRYAYRVFIVEKAVNSKGKADEVFEIVKASSAEGEKAARILLKEAEKPKYKPGQIVQKMHDEGFPEFKAHHHSQLWKDLDARNPAKAFGVFLKDNDWWWYENWLDRVRLHCDEHREKYVAAE